MAHSSGIASSTNNVTVTLSPRVPEYNAFDQEMWFAVVEAYVTKARITNSQLRYLDFVSSLPPRYENEVRDVIMRPLDDESYAVLKRE
jgi:glycine betaine/choline ABC-type transport system substrate-binding protein